ncbi:MAG: MMPL family transporter [Planctomycetes bacterium]|nr:MMPL family transporter [Planctomycetota bacterium]
MMERFLAALRARRGLVLALTALLTALLLLSASGLSLREDVLELLPDRDPVVWSYRRLLEVFRPAEYAYFDVGPREGSAAAGEEELLAAADALAAGLEQARGAAAPLFDRVIYRRDPADLLSAVEFLGEHRASLFSAADAARFAERVQPEAISDALAAWKKLLTLSPAPLLAPALARDPLGFDQALLERLQSLEPAAGALTLHRGRLFSADLRHVLVIARPATRSTDGQSARELVDLVLELLPRAQAQGEGVAIAWLSGHRFSLENAERIKGDLARVVTLSLIGIVLLALLAFRRFFFVVLALLPAAFGAAFAAGMIRWLAPGVSAIAIGCGSMLVGVSVDYGIHILFHADHASAGERVEPLVLRLFAPLSLSAATTLAAFAALSFSVMPGFRQLGLFADLGILGAAGFALLVLPLLISNARPARPPLLDVAAFFPRWFAWARARRVLAAALLALFTLGAALGLPRLAFDGDYRRLNAASPEALADWQRLAATFGEAMETTSVTVASQDSDEALRQNEALCAELERLKAEGMVSDFRSLAPLLPSRATQEENRRRWREFFSEERRNALAERLAAAAQQHGMREGAFLPFLASLERETAPLTLEDWNVGLLGDLGETHVARADGASFLLTGLRLAPGARFTQVVERLERAAPGLLAADGKSFMEHLVALIHGEMGRVGAIGLALVALLVLGAVRRPLYALALLLPPALALLWSFGLMGWLGLRLNLMNCIVFVFVAGLAVDYSVFLFAAWRSARSERDEHLSRSGGSVALSALTTLIAVGSLAAASHPALKSVGQTALFGIAGGWLAALLAVPLAPRAGARPERE